MSKVYSMVFGTGDPRTFTGLAPTFLYYVNLTNGATIAPPAISESLSGSGLYQFTYGTTQPIGFLADAATTSPGAAARYVPGQIDPADRTDEYASTMIALGTSLISLGNSNIALGNSNIALGNSNIALGNSNIAFGTSLIALGNSNIALGMTNFALGTSNIALGNSNIALGNSNVALGTSNFAFGASIFATGVSTQLTVGLAYFNSNSLLTGQSFMGVTLVAIGNTIAVQSVGGLGTSLVAMGNTLSTFGSYMGTTASSFGSTSVDPSTLFGYLKRLQELQEGAQIYTKASGLLDVYDRTQATLLREKTISDTSTQTTKT